MESINGFIVLLLNIPCRKSLNIIASDLVLVILEITALNISSLIDELSKLSIFKRR